MPYLSGVALKLFLQYCAYSCYLPPTHRVSPMKELHRTVGKSPWIGAAIAGLLTAACTTTSTQSFNVVKNRQVEASYIATDANFGKYDRLLASDMGIFFPTDAAPSIEDQQRTRQIFRKAFLAELQEYQLVRTAGPTALNVQATLIDYRNATGADVPNVRRELSDIARPGAIMFLMELKDSRSGKILARAADSASAPEFSTSADTGTDWAAVETAAARWAKLFRQFLDDNLNQ